MSHLEPRLPLGVESALGRFIANFALLEEYLRGIICEIPQTSAPAGEIITSQLRFRDPISCFGALAIATGRSIQITKQIGEYLVASELGRIGLWPQRIAIWGD
jgi:hypothetical protein